jgi:hypothetical protein
LSDRIAAVAAIAMHELDWVSGQKLPKAPAATRNARHMKKRDRALVAAITALGLGLVHCSSDPEQPGGAPATGAAGSGVIPAGGSAPVATAGSATAGGGSAGATGGTSTAGGTGSTGGGGSQTSVSGSGGTPAGGGGAGGIAGGADGDCGADAIVCENFDQYPTASAPAGGWTAALRGDGKIVVDTAQAFSGKQSLHVTGKMNRDHANISRPIQTASPTAYVRFMYYVKSYPASSGVHTRLARLGTMQAASGNPYTSYSLASYNGIAIERVNSIYLRDTGTKLNDSKLLNRWSCMEFAVDMSGGAGKVKVNIWIDGNALTLSPAGSSSHGQTDPTWDPLAFEVFMLGLDGYQDDAEVADYWIDDISVTPQRVGCKPAPP